MLLVRRRQAKHLVGCPLEGLVWSSGVFLVGVGCEFLACIASPVVVSPLIGTLRVKQYVCVCVFTILPPEGGTAAQLFGIPFR